MTEFAKEVLPASLEQEMRDSYMEYAMSVIVGRALPDVRDGLKPVHRRALYAMYEQNNYWNRAYKKSARIVGDVMGKYHPHGDSAIYDTIVRMAQPFSLRYTLVDGQGNFGSVDGDNPAAMRYTEIRMEKIAHELMADLEKETVDFTPNYDDSEHEPSVLPTRIPNLLVNGSSGIAVGMATNIPPHNIKEVISGCIELIDNPEASLDDLMAHIPGPDFPTAAMINGANGIRSAYETGRGKIYLRAKAHFEENESNGKISIIVTELPYQVNKARLIEKIAELVKDKKIEGITELRDESDKDGMRMVIELRRGEVGEVILNNLYQQTQLQTVFGINMVALIDGQPKTLNIKEILRAFLRHRREVVTRRTLFDLRKARERAHILEGLSVALNNVDEIIELIKTSPNPTEAKEKLLVKHWEAGVVSDMLSRAGADACRPENLSKEYGLNNQDHLYQLSPAQAQAILDLRLHRLTGLEQDKIFEEYKAILVQIEDLLDILQNPGRLMTVIREELEEVVENFGDERRTEIIENKLDLTLEDLITEEDRVVTLSHAGYVKTQKLEDYQAQHRGGRGKAATKMKDEDFIDQLLVASTHDMILIFTNKGQVYWKKVFELPQGSRNAKGIPIVNLLPLEDGERINVILPLRNFSDEQYVFFATQNGTVKKTPLVDYSRPRSNGIRAIDLRDSDELIGAAITNGEQNIMLVANSGKGIRFKESDVRSMGRVSAGVRGIKLEDKQKVVSLLVLENEDSMILTATENGYGKRTPFADHKVQGRGGSGVIAIQTSERNGAVIGAVAVEDNGEIMLITSNGTLVRTKVSGVSVVGRNTQGVRLIKLDKKDKLVGLERVLETEEDENTALEDDAITSDATPSPEIEPTGNHDE